MPELPEHVKAEADKVTNETIAKKTPVQDMNTQPAVSNMEDGGKALEAMREQKRKDALQEKNQPDKD